MEQFELNVNGKNHQVNVDPSTPILWVLRDHLQHQRFYHFPESAYALQVCDKRSLLKQQLWPKQILSLAVAPPSQLN